MSAFSYEARDGERQSLGPWELAPHVNDPSRNEAHRSAAKDWNNFSNKVTAVVPFSIVRQENRAQRLEKGDTSANMFSIHEVEPEISEVDGAERPESSNFSLGKTPLFLSIYELILYSQVRSFASIAPDGPDRTAQSELPAKRKAAVHVQRSESPISSLTEDSDASSMDYVPKKVKKKSIARSKRKRGANMSGSEADDTSNEGSQLVPRKRTRAHESSATASQANAYESDPEYNVRQIEPSKPYFEWLSRLPSSSASRPNTDIFDYLTSGYAAPLTVLSFDTPSETVLHPWWNPLNGPTNSWKEGRSPCLRHAIFSVETFDAEFLDVFTQSKAGSTTRRLRKSSSLDSSIYASTLLNPSSSLDAALSSFSDAWADLQRMRSGLSVSGIGLRSSAVVLMAMEAMIWAKLESLATLFSQKPTDGVDEPTGLKAIAFHLWDMVNTRMTAREVDIGPLLSSSSAHPVILEIPPARTARSEFERQRQVYAGLLHFLGNFIGVEDPRDARLRSWLVWLVVDVWGFDALHHAGVWHAWRFPQSRCLVGRLTTKQPSLDDMLPLVGLVSTVQLPSSYPLSALAKLSVEASMVDNEARVTYASNTFLAVHDKAYRWRSASGNDTINPSDSAAILRSLALSDLLIGLQFNDQARSDVSDIESFTWNGKRQNLLPTDKKFLSAVAQNLDMYLPFKELQPSAQRMRLVFQGQQKDALITDIGFKNSVLMRFLSYNAPFLLSGSQGFFTRFEDVLASIQDAGREECYFVSHRIYGRNLNRSTKNVRSVWESSIFPTPAGRSFKRFWSALHEGYGPEHRYKVRFVGPLLALHIAGDYFAAGYLDEPTVQDMAEIIRLINSGGVKGLRAMGFIPDHIPVPAKSSKYDLRVVQKAFSDYYTWLTASVDPANLVKWRWSVVSAENHLCKHLRLLDEVRLLGR
ncbi:unnamed protein product [Peniophora sp. CBMAI 1063]|nr:unnamed protein product [Peniophora sp. CBMAI 1063]